MAQLPAAGYAAIHDAIAQPTLKCRQYTGGAREGTVVAKTHRNTRRLTVRWSLPASYGRIKGSYRKNIIEHYKNSAIMKTRFWRRAASRPVGFTINSKFAATLSIVDRRQWDRLGIMTLSRSNVYSPRPSPESSNARWCLFYGAGPLFVACVLLGRLAVCFGCPAANFGEPVSGKWSHPFWLEPCSLAPGHCQYDHTHDTCGCPTNCREPTVSDTFS